MKRLTLLTIKTATWLIASQTFAQSATAPSEIIYDTVATLKTRLSVTNNGYMGQAGAGGVNLDYTAIGGDCDSTATVYLRDGGPFIIQSLGDGQYRMSASMHQDGSLESPLAFRPIDGWNSPAHISGPNYDGHFSGTFINWDSSIACEVTTFAPTGGYDSSSFIIRRYDFFPADSNTHAGLTIGTAIDWDIPSDVGSNNNAYISTEAETVYFLGTDDPENTDDCQDNAVRLGAQSFLGWYSSTDYNQDDCVKDRDYFGIYAARNDSDRQLIDDTAYAEFLWTKIMTLPGRTGLEDEVDVHQIMTFLHDVNLGATDTLTFYTALATVQNGTVAELESTLATACDWYDDNLRPGCYSMCGCCVGMTGNVDNDPEDIVDIGDLTKLIDYLFISYTPPVCMEEANVDGVGIVDIGDLTKLIGLCFYCYGWWCYAPC
ncbi:MAG: hypothetical protein JSU65_13785 [Candidatus Zixiibacteriota bacterium]|nr:MAG: hypothetical protein JSU65_13785 [candidate division Zixibacteria bacterium]